MTGTSICVWTSIPVRLAVLAVAGLGFATPAQAQTKTLPEAFAKAYAGNPTLEAARAELRSVDEQMPQALSNFRPTITGSFDIGKQRSFTKSSGSSFGGRPFENKQNTTPRTYGLTVEQPIFRGFRSFAETRQALATIRAQRARLTTSEQSVLLQVVTAYMDVLRDQAVLQLNVNNVRVLSRQLRATRDRFRVGEVTRTDVAQAEARLASARADRVQSEGDLDSSRASFREVVGDLPGKLKRPVRPKFLPSTLEEAVATAGKRDPNVVAARYVERAARENVDVIGGELLPTVSVRGEFTRSANTNGPQGLSDSDRVTFTITIPLYQAGATTSRLRAAKQVVSQRRMEIIAARRNAVAAATRAWESFESSRAQVKAFRSAVKANRIALNGVREEAAAGLRTVLDTLDAEQELLSAEVNLVRANRDEIVAAYEVLSAMGRLTAVDLGLKVNRYDPRRHYESVKWKFWGLGDRLPPKVE